MHTSLVSLFFILASLNSANAIVGGFFTADVRPDYINELEVDDIQHHTVVLLDTTTEGQHSRCTGTLIRENVVLTAAHCIPNDPKKNLWVVTSIYEFALLERKAVTNVIVHQGYKSFDLPKVNQPNYDIALVQFQGALPDLYKPTTWATTSVPSLDRFWLYVAGYGVSSKSAADSGELRLGKVTIENNLFLQNQSYMTGNQSTGEGICKGDSGGPAYMKDNGRFLVLGTVSAITGECSGGVSYFNRMSFYDSWLNENVAKLASP